MRKAFQINIWAKLPFAITRRKSHKKTNYTLSKYLGQVDLTVLNEQRLQQFSLVTRKVE